MVKITHSKPIDLGIRPEELMWDQLRFGGPGIKIGLPFVLAGICSKSTLMSMPMTSTVRRTNKLVPIADGLPKKGGALEIH